MRFLSVCSGIEAASVAWEPLGWQASGFAEIEPFPCAVLAHHYPDVPNHGDMTLLPAKIRAGEVEAPDLLCGGTPCQAFSVAGLRQSLDDARGNLTLTFCEIADAIDAMRKRPSIIFWENVPGVLNTKDNAFGCFLGALAGEDDALVAPGGRWANAGFVDGPQRAVAWRVLDAQYFGVAQRRRRVFVVASARADFDPAAVLFEFDGLRRDTAPSRQARQTVAGGVEIGPGGGRLTDLNPTLDTRAKDGPIRNQLAGAVLTLAHGQGGAEIGFDRGPTLTCNHEAPIAIYALQGAGKTSQGSQGSGWNKDVSFTLNTIDVHGVAQPIPLDLRNAGRDPEKHDEMNRQGVGVGEPGDPSHTLTTACVHGVAQSVNIYGGNKRPDRPGGGFYVRMNEDTSKTLDAASGLNPTCSQGGTAIMQHMAVRRLTPVECERLQGFPDNYTNIPWRKAAESPDGPRYKALGNSWAVPVVQWIGERIERSLA